MAGERKEGKRRMKKDTATNIQKNVVFGLFGQIIILALGIVIPRLILVSYGSEFNGLVTTVTQIFAYVALLEAGIGNAAINAFYKPIIDENRNGISTVFSAAQKYFHKVTLIYGGCVCLLTVVYPQIVTSELPKLSIALIVLFQGFSGVVTFYFAASYKQLMIADGKNYIVSNIHLLVYILSSTIKIILMNKGVDIVVLQFWGFVVNSIQTVFYIAYVKKKYPWLSYERSADTGILHERKAFLVHEISNTVFTSTDAFILSAFCNLKIVSVYAVYNMIFSALNSLINSINNGLIYLLGYAYVGDREKYIKIHDAYDSLYMALVFAAFSIAYVMIIPFVGLYTRGIVDIQYVDRELPILFVGIQLLSCCRAVSSRLITISGHAKETQVRSIIEAAINLVASIVLVNFIGIYGVLLGTIVALLYRTNDIIIYANKKILHRSPWLTYKKVILNMLAFIAVVFIERWMRSNLDSACSSYYAFSVIAVPLSVATCLLYFGLALAMNKDMTKTVVLMMKQRIRAK